MKNEQLKNYLMDKYDIDDKFKNISNGKKQEISWEDFIRWQKKKLFLIIISIN